MSILMWPRPFAKPGGDVETIYIVECKCPPEERRCPVKERGVCGACGGAVVGELELFSNNYRIG